MIDLFDWGVGRRCERIHLTRRGWWVHLKYYLLTGTLVAALCGVLVSAFVAAIPVVARPTLYSRIGNGWLALAALGVALGIAARRREQGKE